MHNFPIEETQSAITSPYREIIFSHTDDRYFFTVFENHKEIFHSSFYKDQDDCAERGATYLENSHQQRPLYQDTICTPHPPAMMQSTKGKSIYDG